ncbi:MAG: ABC transporter permease [Bryobacterales bacterium]|nr:ABC transporter permease [Bryobacterales bacterium]
MLRETLRRLRFWYSDASEAAGLDDEMRLHIELRAEKLRAMGVPPGEALWEARKRFGNQLHVRERSRDMWVLPSIDDLLRDVRLAARALGRQPGFTATAVLTLALGIGANTAIFSVVNGVLLKPLSYADPDKLVAVNLNAPGAQGFATASGHLLLSASMFVTFAEQNRTFEAMGVWAPGTASVTGSAEPEHLRTLQVSDGVLSALQAQPVLGRTMGPADHAPDGAQVVMLLHGYWQRRFGGDRSVIGRSLLVDGQPREIAGVLGEGFRVVDTPADILLPLRFDRSRLLLPGFGLRGLGRLKPGVNLAQANADITRLIPVWMGSWPTLPGVDPKVYEHWRMSGDLRPLQEEVTGGVGKDLWILMAAIGVVLLIAAVNVANLMLARIESRRQELATRTALGAGVGRIVRSVLAESLLLALAGGAIGLALAAVAVRALVSSGLTTLPRLAEISVDGASAGITLLFSVGAGLVAGAIPAIRCARGPLAEVIRSAGRTSSGNRERGRTRSGLVIAQVAMAVVLLLCAGLMIRTFAALRGADPGFTGADSLQTARISIPGPADKLLRAQMDLVEGLRAIPGVESAAFVSETPMDGGRRNWDAVCLEGKGFEAGEIPPTRTFKMVSPGLFRTMGTRLIAGRDFTWTDVTGRRPMVLLSESLAREYFEEPQQAIGKRVGTCVPGSVWREVIGVVQDVHDEGLHKAATATVYWPSMVDEMYPANRNYLRNLALVVRTKAAGGETLTRQMNQAVWGVNKSIPLANVQTMAVIVERSMARTSFAMVMLAIAGAMALFLGVVGIYGVISYSVTQRRRESGIRLALGAQPSEVCAGFVVHSLWLTGMGVAIGLAAGAGVTRLMDTLLYRTSRLDPVTFAMVAAVLLLAAVLSSYLPARRAARVDPAVTLRADG